MTANNLRVVSGILDDFLSSLNMTLCGFSCNSANNIHFWTVGNLISLFEHIGCLLVSNIFECFSLSCDSGFVFVIDLRGCFGNFFSSFGSSISRGFLDATDIELLSIKGLNKLLLERPVEVVLLLDLSLRFGRSFGTNSL